MATMQLALLAALVVGLQPAASPASPPAETPATTTTSTPSEPARDPTSQPTPPRASKTPVLVEQCDGAREPSRGKPSGVDCQQWRVEWMQGGKVWGVTSASSLSAVIDKREHITGFERQYARYFGQAFDTRFDKPTHPICEACASADGGGTSGLWGDDQKFGGIPTQRALQTADAAAEALEKAIMEEHTPRLGDIARLTRDGKTQKAAKQYAKDLRAAVDDVVTQRLVLENAAIFRDPGPVQRAAKLLQARTKGLSKDFDVLSAAVAKEVARVHGGVYLEDGQSGPDAPRMVVTVDGCMLT